MRVGGIDIIGGIGGRVGLHIERAGLRRLDPQECGSAARIGCPTTSERSIISYLDKVTCGAAMLVGGAGPHN